MENPSVCSETKAMLWKTLLRRVDYTARRYQTGINREEGHYGATVDLHWMTCRQRVPQSDGTDLIIDWEASVTGGQFVYVTCREHIDSLDYHWGTVCARSNPQRRVVVNHEHYLIGSESD